MKKPVFSGVYAALLTPFDEKGAVSEPRLRKHVEFLVGKGIDGLYVCGGTGEGLLMDVEDRKRVAEITRDQVGNRPVSLIAQVGGALNTANAAALARHAEKIGFNGVSSFPPTYYAFRFEAMYSYYEAVAGASGLPFLIYYIPATTNVVLPNEKIAELGAIPTIVGLKYTNPDFFKLQDLLQMMDGKWIALSGPDELFLPALTMGVTGSIGSTQNVLPEIFLGIHRAFLTGDIKEAMRLQTRVTQAVSMLYTAGGMTAWKTALRCYRGVDVGFGRPPMPPTLPPEREKVLREQWKRLFPDFCEGVKNSNCG